MSESSSVSWYRYFILVISISLLALISVWFINFMWRLSSDNYQGGHAQSGVRAWNSLDIRTKCYEKELSDNHEHQAIPYFHSEISGSIGKRFYEQAEVFPFLSSLQSNRGNIIQEVSELKDWATWPEQDLIPPGNDWKIVPFLGFGTWVTPFCDACPVLNRELRKIKGLRSALLSRLGPDTTLTAHQGWASLANDVLRVHYGIDVPDKCRVFVEGHSRKLKNNEFCVFDDSKMHWAANLSSNDRTVLILDIERPAGVPRGVSEIGETPELLRIVDHYKRLAEQNSKI